MAEVKLPAEVELQAETLAFLDREHHLYIGGEWVEAHSGASMNSINPATGQVLTAFASAGSADVDRAVEAARQAFDSGPWRSMSGVQRGETLWKIADVIEAHTQELAELETLDNGKPFKLASRVDLPQTIKHFRYYAGWASKIEGRTVPVSFPNNLVYTVREPVGVCGLIIPWNYPLQMAAWKLAPALAAGNTCILKPAEETSLTALRLAELLKEEVGLPEGVVNVVTGPGVPTGAAITAHMGVDKVAFTGSTEVGRKILAASAESNLKKVSLELGGKSPNVIFADADLEQAIRGAVWAIFSTAGQECVAGSRLFIERPVYDQVMEGIAEQAAKIRVGNGFGSAHIGPIVSEQQLERIMGYLEEGRESGVEYLTGAERIGEEGYFVAPTVFRYEDDSLRLVKEEIFGPVVGATAFADFDEVVARANQTPYGLAAGVWTKDIGKAHRFAEAVRAGTVWINLYGYIDAAAPFGGYKQSGLGREMGANALDLYTETKAVWVNTAS